MQLTNNELLALAEVAGIRAEQKRYILTSNEFGHPEYYTLAETAKDNWVEWEPHTDFNHLQLVKEGIRNLGYMTNEVTKTGYNLYQIWAIVPEMLMNELIVSKTSETSIQEAVITCALEFHNQIIKQGKA